MDNSNSKKQSRRQFLSLGLSDKKDIKVDTDLLPETNPLKNEKVKMLTPDGKLVEINREILDRVTVKKRATNKEIYDWMNNPCKDNNF